MTDHKLTIYLPANLFLIVHKSYTVNNSARTGKNSHKHRTRVQWKSLFKILFKKKRKLIEMNLDSNFVTAHHSCACPASPQHKINTGPQPVSSPVDICAFFYLQLTTGLLFSTPQQKSPRWRTTYLHWWDRWPTTWRTPPRRCPVLSAIARSRRWWTPAARSLLAADSRGWATGRWRSGSCPCPRSTGN